MFKCIYYRSLVIKNKLTYLKIHVLYELHILEQNQMKKKQENLNDAREMMCIVKSSRATLWFLKRIWKGGIILFLSKYHC